MDVARHLLSGRLGWVVLSTVAAEQHVPGDTTHGE